MIFSILACSGYDESTFYSITAHFATFAILSLNFPSPIGMLSIKPEAILNYLEGGGLISKIDTKFAIFLIFPSHSVWEG